ncbi:hypothetical protein [Streptomyces noursei]|uniref:hypothetical protein n=1 Tax=Streptomyces noursei TaxID=1971 RepID=UPI001672B47D|nr:hypothetical protein [Streptomyces noursei]MCZ1015051.1 hypothetical protein [Streptomyces noursei]GGX02717.1 hypothetical protein GCM10010341_25410 [Streptomyces noursei]
MAGNAWARAVREQLGIGRVLPLGGPADGAWITERAARAALLRAPGTPPGVRLAALRLSLAAPDDAPAPAVPAPPSALPPGPLRIAADFTAPPGRPLPALAARLRTALLTTAEDGLGLRVGAVDLRVTDLLDGADGGRNGPRDDEAPEGEDAAREGAGPGGDGREPADLAARVLAVPGVARLAPALAGRSRPVTRTGGHVLIQLTTAAGHRPLDVARAVRRAVTGPPPAPESAAVLVTAVAGD